MEEIQLLNPMLRVTIQYGVLEMLLRIFKAFFEILYVTFMYRCIQIFGVEICGKEPLGRPRRRWQDYIKIYLQEIRFFFGVGGLVID